MSVTIVCENPKYVENLGGVIRAAACFEAERVLWTGTRIPHELNSHERRVVKKTSGGHAKVRHLRQFRMKDYVEVDYHHNERPFDELFTSTSAPIPICVEFDGSENLADFTHPNHAIYVFGPEDGSVGWQLRRLCHRFVRIPSKFCLNLAASVNVILADRAMKNSRLEISNNKGEKII